MDDNNFLIICGFICLILVNIITLSLYLSVDDKHNNFTISVCQKMNIECLVNGEKVTDQHTSHLKEIREGKM